MTMLIIILIMTSHRVRVELPARLPGAARARSPGGPAEERERQRRRRAPMRADAPRELRPMRHARGRGLESARCNSNRQSMARWKAPEAIRAPEFFPQAHSSDIESNTRQAR